MGRKTAKPKPKVTIEIAISGDERRVRAIATGIVAALMKLAPLGAQAKAAGAAS